MAEEPVERRGVPQPKRRSPVERTLYEALAEPADSDFLPGQTHVTAAKETIDWDQEDDPTLFLDEKCVPRR